jgi:hypothetical protein
MPDRRTPIIPGPQGPEGERGERGPAGRPGKSAYELACDAGYRGSLKQWLESLRVRGDRGDQGEPGADGAPGAPGAAAVPMHPTRARFVRDEDTQLTKRVLVTFPTHSLAIDPVRDEDSGLMVAAEFSVV